MKRTAFAIGIFLAATLAVIALKAQSILAPTNVAAMVCAANTSAPTPTNGQFYYIQCDSSGKLITSGGGSASAITALTGNCTATGPGSVPITCSNLSASALTSGTIPVARLPTAYLRVHQASAQSFTSGSAARVTFDTVDFGTGYNTTNHQFAPTTAGTYQICTSIVAGGSGNTTVGNTYIVDITRNGSQQAEFFNVIQGAIGTIPAGGGCTLVQMNGTTDVLEVDYTVTTSLTAITSSTPNNRVYMTAALVGP